MADDGLQLARSIPDDAVVTINAGGLEMRIWNAGDLRRAATVSAKIVAMDAEQENGK